MHITWTRMNDLGETVTENHPTITTENARGYAKNTCCTCWGIGYNFYDNGRMPISTIDENGKVSTEWEYINPRNILCDCSLRTIQKAGL